MPLLLTSAALAGCGGGDSTRDRVDAYLKAATGLQQEAKPRFTAANEAYVAFARDELEPQAAIARFERAETDIAAARDDLAELEPPVEARRLHSRLVLFYDQNLAFARATTSTPPAGACSTAASTSRPSAT
jgi:hypothetical protein